MLRVPGGTLRLPKTIVGDILTYPGVKEGDGPIRGRDCDTGDQSEARGHYHPHRSLMAGTMAGDICDTGKILLDCDTGKIMLDSDTGLVTSDNVGTGGRDHNNELW